MRPLLLASSNEGKIVEMRERLAGLPVQLLTLRDFPDLPAPPEETGTSHEENAIAKARSYFALARIPTIAEDSGIHVETLEGELGVQTRRWGAGPEASDEEWIQHFLERMQKEKNKRARFHCVIALACFDMAPPRHAERSRSIVAAPAQHDIVVHTFEGECPGTITDTLEALYLPGLPISACFKPDGYDRVFSALTIEEKNRVSHRGRALARLEEFLAARL